MYQTVIITIITLLFALFALAQLRSLLMVALYFAQRGRGRFATPAAPADWPPVVVQLPVYREQRVLDRLLSSVLAMDYPKGRMSVQVIDDSEEHEACLSESIVRKYYHGPVKVDYLRRNSRTGYKAGALNYGTRQSDAELIAIFDADFAPVRDFLLKTVPYFQDETIGAVQSRWGYLNDMSKPLTLMQAAVFDSMFCFEQSVRQGLGRPVLFLGTAGVWRKKTIEDLGGWREVPFTSEDIDLTYRAHLAGWRIVFQDEPLADSELPATYLDYKSQQRRWARGCFRTFLDLSGQVFKPRPNMKGRFDVAQLLDPTLLLMQFGMPMLVLLLPVVVLYMLLGLPRSNWWMTMQIGLSLFMVASPLALELILSQRLLYRNWTSRARLLIRGVPLGVGLSVSLLAGFWDTLRRSETEFVKTPKQGDNAVIKSSQRRWLQNALRITLMEILLGLLAVCGLALAVKRYYPESWLLLFSFASSYLISGWTSLTEIRRKLKGSDAGDASSIQHQEVERQVADELEEKAVCD